MHLLTLVFLAASANQPTLPPGDGKDIVQRACVGCHVLKVVTSKRATPDQWSTLVNQMVSRGAEVDDDDIDTVIKYLSKNFPAAKDSESAATDHPRTVNVNAATAAELSSELGLSADEAAAVVAYRKQNGNFKTADDLAKVRGLDAKKIESVKDRLRF